LSSRFLFGIVLGLVKYVCVEKQMWYLCTSFTKNMRKILLLFCIVVLSISILAQTQSKIKIKNSDWGKITVVRGKTRSTINLSKDISGCAYVSDSEKRILEKNNCAVSPAKIRLVDVTVKNNLIFLVVQSNAAGSCNICDRQCGRDESTSLIWLKLDARLRLLKKKSIPIEDCSKKIYLFTPEINFDEQTQTAKLMERGIIVMEFEKILGEDGFQYTHLEYNWKTPEKGFVIKTEKRVRSSAQQQ
jgi:hypothetical protein